MNTYLLQVPDYREFEEAIISAMSPNSVSRLNPLSYHILKNFCKPVSSDVRGYNVRPVRVLASLRTDLTNEVAVTTEGDFFLECTVTDSPVKRPLNDMVILAGKNLVEKVLDCEKYLPIFISRTSLWVAGVFMHDSQIYVYMNVVIDNTLKEEEGFNLKGCKFVDIEKITASNPIQEEILNKLIVTTRSESG